MYTKLTYFNTKEQFEAHKSELPNSIVAFIKDTGELYTHGQFFSVGLSVSGQTCTLTRGNVSVDLALSNHTHEQYLLKTGGTITGDLDIKGKLTASNLPTIKTIDVTQQLTVNWKNSIECSPVNFPDGDGTYAVQVFVDSEVNGIKNVYFSGILSILSNSKANMASTYEVLLHCGGFQTDKLIYLRVLYEVGQYGKIQMACSNNLPNAMKLTFKFKKLI